MKHLEARAGVQGGFQAVGPVLILTLSITRTTHLLTHTPGRAGVCVQAAGAAWGHAGGLLGDRTALRAAG